MSKVRVRPEDDAAIGRSGGFFTKFAKRVSSAAGRPATFAAALTIIVVWGVSGPLFRFNDTWQLAINTGTTIVTFLMVFVIQNSQNRDSLALQIKLDELIHAIDTADNRLLDLEELDEATLTERQHRFEEIAEAARRGEPT